MNRLKIKPKLKFILIPLIIISVLILAFIALWYWKTTAESAALQNYSKQTESGPGISLTLAELAQYDGTDPAKPIYLVFEGKIYDVSAGKKYYAIGGGYHFLAGTDSTPQLRLIGGDIIKAKYPVVGILKN